MLMLIDNYDSFTYNLMHFLGELGAEVTVKRNDAITVAELLDRSPEAVVMSPGPCDPDRAGICLEMVERGAGKVPLLGVCLGHQAVGQAFGGRIAHAPTLMHGKMSAIRHNGEGVFAGLPNPFDATRYHALIVADPLPEVLTRTAFTQRGEIMGLRHSTQPIFGLQFHPESFLTTHGKQILRNFLDDGRAGSLLPASAKHAAA